MRRLVLVTSLLVVLAGCAEPSVSPSTGPADPIVDQLAEARARWQAADLTTYRFVFEDDCGECNPVTQTVVVWDGEPTDPSAPTIEEVFDVIETAASGTGTVEVLYDPELGYPTDVWIDREARAYDGGLHWMVHNLADGLPGTGASLDDLAAAQARWERNRPAAYQFEATIACDCPLAGSLWTKVDGDRVVDWRVETESSSQEQRLAPITIDAMFADLIDLLSGEVVEEGVRFTGSAEFDTEFGHPIWVGLDIEILDPASPLAGLPPRLVYTVTEFEAVE